MLDRLDHRRRSSARGRSRPASKCRTNLQSMPCGLDSRVRPRTPEALPAR